MSDLSLDAFALLNGFVAEDLSQVRYPPEPFASTIVLSRAAAQHLYATEPAVPWEDLAPRDRGTLVDGGWYAGDGTYTRAGLKLRRDLLTGMSQGKLHRTDDRGQQRATIVTGISRALLLVEPHVRHWASKGDCDDAVVQVETLPVTAIPIVMARWGRLSPAWTFDTEHGPIAPELILRRLQDPRTPVPEDADASLAAMWAEPWLQWSATFHRGATHLSYLNAGDRGQYVFKEAEGGWVQLVARPGTLVWGDLQRLLTRPGQGDPERLRLFGT